MNVRQLITQLADYSPNAEVVIHIHGDGRAEINVLSNATPTNPYRRGALEQLFDEVSAADVDTTDVDDWITERATQAGMEGGVQAYNDAMGYDLTAPDPCGHHCGSDCPRCGDWR